MSGCSTTRSFTHFLYRWMALSTQNSDVCLILPVNLLFVRARTFYPWFQCRRSDRSTVPFYPKMMVGRVLTFGIRRLKVVYIRKYKTGSQVLTPQTERLSVRAHLDFRFEAHLFLLSDVKLIIPLCDFYFASSGCSQGQPTS